jgi:hypothetical protein
VNVLGAISIVVHGRNVEAMQVTRRFGGWKKILRDNRNCGTSAAKAAGIVFGLCRDLRSCRGQALGMN